MSDQMHVRRSALQGVVTDTKEQSRRDRHLEECMSQGSFVSLCYGSLTTESIKSDNMLSQEEYATFLHGLSCQFESAYSRPFVCPDPYLDFTNLPFLLRFRFVSDVCEYEDGVNEDAVDCMEGLINTSSNFAEYGISFKTQLATQVSSEGRIHDLCRDIYDLVVGTGYITKCTGNESAGELTLNSQQEGGVQTQSRAKFSPGVGVGLGFAVAVLVVALVVCQKMLRNNDKDEADGPIASGRHLKQTPTDLTSTGSPQNEGKSKGPPSESMNETVRSDSGFSAYDKDSESGEDSDSGSSQLSEGRQSEPPQTTKSVQETKIGSDDFSEPSSHKSKENCNAESLEVGAA